MKTDQKGSDFTTKLTKIHQIEQKATKLADCIIKIDPKLAELFRISSQQTNYSMTLVCLSSKAQTTRKHYHTLQTHYTTQSSLEKFTQAHKNASEKSINAFFCPHTLLLYHIICLHPIIFIKIVEILW